MVYAVLGWMAIALGVIHIAATPHYSAHSTHQAALWFASGGLTIILTGALNLLNRAYGRGAAGLRWVTVAANLTITTFSVLTGIAGHPTLRWGSSAACLPVPSCRAALRNQAEV